MRFVLTVTGFICLVLGSSVEAQPWWRPYRPALDPTVIFNSADADDNNCLSEEELVVALRQARVQKLPSWIVTKIYAHYDANNDNCLDLDEFKLLFTASQASNRRYGPSLFEVLFGTRSKVPIVAADIFNRTDRQPKDNCLNRLELRATIVSLGGGKLPLWVVDVLLAEYAADDTCLTSTEYNTFVAEFRDLRRAEIFDNYAGDDNCLSFMKFQKAIRTAVGSNLPIWSVKMLLELYDADNSGCINETEFDAFMNALEI